MALFRLFNKNTKADQEQPTLVQHILVDTIYDRLDNIYGLTASYGRDRIEFYTKGYRAVNVTLYGFTPFGCNYYFDNGKEQASAAHVSYSLAIKLVSEALNRSYAAWEGAQRSYMVGPVR